MKLAVLKNNVPINEVLIEISDSNDKYEIFIGRSEDCHVKIDDPLISRHHMVLRNEYGKWFAEKLTTLGVVSLNGAIVSKTQIVNGDELRCGNYSILVSGLSSLTESINKVQIEEPYIPPRVIIAPEEVKPQLIAETPISFQSENTFNSETDSFSPPVNDEINESTGMVEVENDYSGSSESGPSDFDDSQNDFSGGELAEVDGGFEVSADMDEGTRVFKAFVNYQLVLFGEHAPYDRFQLEIPEVFIGRDAKKCQISLNDPEVSTVHAVIRKNNTEITLEDLNSSNGTILNGERINKSILSAGDEFVIGGTSFTLEVRSDLLDAESDRLMPVESGQSIETEVIEDEEVEVGQDGNLNFENTEVEEKSPIKRFWNRLNTKQKIIYGLAALVGFYMFVSNDEPEVNKPAVKKETKTAQDPKATKAVTLSKEQTERRNTSYELGVDYFEQGKYNEALGQFEIVKGIDPEYKKVMSYYEQTTASLKKIAELEIQKRAEEERIKLKKVVEELLEKARRAVEEKQVQLAENYFSQITEKDPENIEVQQLKMELESWQKEEEKKALAIATRESARKSMVDALSPGKTYYLKKEWYRSILKLEEFLRRKGLDEDLVKEASDMLSDAKNQLASELGPLLGKARSFKEGQDLKSAYEAYLDVLKVEPTNAEALNEVDDIKSQLESRSKKIYREAIIAESLSLFNDAKEKFQEVQQVSPTDSEYYKKATDKLKDYLE